MPGPHRLFLRIPIGAVLVVLTACGLSAAAEPAGLGDRVVAFCKEHRGKRVGNGECTTLAAAALSAAAPERTAPLIRIAAQIAARANRAKWAMISLGASGFSSWSAWKGASRPRASSATSAPATSCNSKT